MPLIHNVSVGNMYSIFYDLINLNYLSHGVSDMQNREPSVGVQASNYLSHGVSDIQNREPSVGLQASNYLSHGVSDMQNREPSVG